MSKPALNWVAIDADPRFQALHQKKSRFLIKLMVISMAYYFMLPVMAAYYPNVFNIQVWGPVNIGLLFALSEFVVAWAIAVIYARRANNEFDAMAAELANDAHKFGA